MCNKQQNLETEKKTNNIPYKYCLNCQSELYGKYCHVCGQQATSLKPTIKEFFLEYLNNAYMWDPKLFKTLWKLVSRPGYLTNEYISGKFVSNVHPLKLNMFVVFVFITLFLLFSNTEKLSNSVHDLTNDESVKPVFQMELLMRDQEFAKKITESPRDTVQLFAPLALAENYPEIITNLETIEDSQKEFVKKWTAAIPHRLIEDEIIVLDTNGCYRFSDKNKMNLEEIKIIDNIWKQMVRLLTQYFPLIVLLTTPFLSLSLSFVQRKNKRPHINHFIFSLHYIAFLEVLIMFIYLIYLIAAPSLEILEWILRIGSCVYLALAFRMVYGITSWFKLIINTLFINVVYFVICLSAFIIIFITACIIVAI